MTACLLVYKGSFPYVNTVVKSLNEILCEVFADGCKLIVCTSIDDARIGDASFIFIIGENFGRFKRLKSRRYIYLNFSVLTILGNPFNVAIRGYQSVFIKRQLLNSKIDLFDALLDYYPPQTRVLSESLKIPVFGFVPFVKPNHSNSNLSLSDKIYDICFVGGLSSRRKSILKMLGDSGCSLSPTSGQVLEDVASHSRITLNIHYRRSNHLEIPRLVGAMSSSAIISEESYGIRELFPKEIVKSVPYASIVKESLNLLSNQDYLQNYMHSSRNWYTNIGAPRFKSIFYYAVIEIRNQFKTTQM